MLSRLISIEKKGKYPNTLLPCHLPNGWYVLGDGWGYLPHNVKHLRPPDMNVVYNSLSSFLINTFKFLWSFPGMDSVRELSLSLRGQQWLPLALPRLSLK